MTWRESLYGDWCPPGFTSELDVPPRSAINLSGPFKVVDAFTSMVRLACVSLADETLVQFYDLLKRLKCLCDRESS